MTLINAINKYSTSVFTGIFLFLGVFLTGCTSLNTLVINVEKPAPIILPNSVNTILVVNNAIPQPHDIGNIEYKKGHQSSSPISVNTDSIDYIIARSLFNEIGEKEYFKDVVLYQYPIRDDSNFENIEPLDSTLIKELCSINQADAILSIDRFLISTASYETDLDYPGLTYKYLDAKMDVRFSIYSDKGATMSPPLYMNDSIFWEANYSRNIPLSDTIPSKEQVMREAAGYMAGKIANTLVPYWDNEVRLYYGDVKAANKMVQSDNWSGALALWQSAYDTEVKNEKKKARLAYNIALAYELSDNLTDAIKWITNSCDLFNKTEQTGIDKENLNRATSYKAQLLDRYNDFRLLDKREKAYK